MFGSEKKSSAADNETFKSTHTFGKEGKEKKMTKI